MSLKSENIEKAIDVIKYDLDDKRPLIQFLGKYEVFHGHEEQLIQQLKLVFFDMIGQYISAENDVYLFLKGSISSDQSLLTESFQVLKPSIMFTFGKQFYNCILQSNEKRHSEQKLYFLIQFPFFQGVYMSQLRTILPHIPLIKYYYKTNLSSIIPGMLCIIKSGSILLQSNNKKLNQQFSIITEKDVCGEVHFIDQDGRINLKQIHRKNISYESICHSEVVEVYLISIFELMEFLNLTQLKQYLKNKYKQRMQKLNHTIAQKELQRDKSISTSPEKQFKPSPIRLKTQNAIDQQYDNLKANEHQAIEKVKEVVKLMNYSYHRTKNYFQQKPGAANIPFYKVFMNEHTDKMDISFKQSNRKLSLKQFPKAQSQSSRTQRCKTMANNDFTKSIPIDSFCKKIKIIHRRESSIVQKLSTRAEKRSKSIFE